MYQAVLPMKHHQPAICSVCQNSEDASGEHIVIRSEDEVNVDLMCAVDAAVWKDTHITFTFVAKARCTKVDAEREVLKRVVRFCRHGHKIDIQFQGEYC
jgi:hypothetical protein